MTDFVDKGKLLRVAECNVEKVKQARFEQMLKDAGNMAMTPGMLSGAFGKRENGRYMDASLWDNEDSPQRISVSLIELHPKWMFI
ncbi:hypothetical protein ACQKM1_21825 [Peribacillus frigoritolerans]|uniref:hypothetical protein n=1 Tax=Peribacillus frigoritolerans TaxID=450367 RepID=UPI003D03F51F